jgi:hypothetical protein
VVVSRNASRVSDDQVAVPACAREREPYECAFWYPGHATTLLRVSPPDLRLRTFLRIAYTSRPGFWAGLASVVAFGLAALIRGDWLVVVLAVAVVVTFVLGLFGLWRRNGGRRVKLRR